MFIDSHGLRIYLNDKVYSPKEDSYMVVDCLRSELKNVDSLIELGSGTGIILLSLIQQLQISNCLAVDINFEASKLTLKNAKANDLGEYVQVVCSSSLLPFRRKSLPAIAIFNPPYLPEDPEIDPHTPVWEYHQLVGGSSGIETVSDFIQKADSKAISYFFIVISSMATNPIDFAKLFPEWKFEIVSSEKMSFETIWLLKGSISKTGVN